MLDTTSQTTTRRTRQFEGKTVAVVGMAQTGIAAASVLQRLGAHVVLSDRSSPAQLGDRLGQAQRLGVDLRPEATPDQALEGASIVVPSPGVSATSDVLRLAQERGLPILSEVEVAYRVSRAPILAVTGTNGKSTTTVWLARMLEGGGQRAWIAGNIRAGDIQRPLIDAAEQAEENDFIVAEISSFQLEWAERFRPKVGVLTNIKRDHIDRHGSLQEYARCKARLFAAQRPDDIAVMNSVNVPSRAIGVRLRSRVMWFDCGHCGQSDWACVREGKLSVRFGSDEHTLVATDELQIPGRHNIENALAASAAAIAVCADPDAIRRALRTFRGLPDRMEPVAEEAGVLFINSSMTTNVDAAVRALEAVGRPVVLIAGGKDKASDFGPLGHAMTRYATHAVLIGEAAQLIEHAAWAADFRHISHACSMDEAVRQAARLARPGDAVMLAPACASQDMFADFEARGRAFTLAVRALLDRERQGA